MKRSLYFASLMLLALASLPVVGCRKEDPADVPKPPAAEGAAAAADEDAALAKLSPEDRAAVAAQKICPVTGEDLASMGGPIKVSVEGRDVFVCCEGCVEKLEANPAEYLAKLDPPAASTAPADVASEPAADN
ncbi:MAG TPA: hypothetical protein VEQ85_15060 [Lacipirellulaceae bacterium]|nr:hypothetical protein [Lacipirellulaceae bacterium]